ncbi:1-(5-phosphoribosyl)-5-[(5-phosphoribosylamino)methylideneamino]imidazole-4-carboxamide isomerase [uncultured Duncaniella sp.]|uniref:1-(5-phosphoribosyl)-5-[(5- phosphoribosylamino)methylideneamino]imidazole-4- carboxamide isomerase n=1 Tax=uncultured Duncaniella sp. TaxID=2768039 RepID=UPI0025B5A47F|nr:1-(5-phosphoribosyl)-5-[(5-phosphoribosylamino)methylideneamino]imidazole-4-carboxamide isomerase [uncultured Duncaniella sp.]
MIEVIPAIDLIDGKCVRLSQGDYDRCTDYGASPVDMAKLFLDNGLTRIHLVDLDGAKASAPRNLRTLEQIARLDGVEVEWGGGIKTDRSLKDVFNAGGTYAIIGSVAVRQPELMARWLDEHGGERLVLGADVRDGRVAVSGWMEETSATIDDLIRRFRPHGLTQAICTDISKDGMLEGPAYGLYERLDREFPDVIFTVSGGVSSIDDIIRLDALGMKRVITGKALYENRISLIDLRRFVD